MSRQPWIGDLFRKVVLGRGCSHLRLHMLEFNYQSDYSFNNEEAGERRQISLEHLTEHLDSDLANKFNPL
jgi:hypothetical protein